MVRWTCVAALVGLASGAVWAQGEREGHILRRSAGASQGDASMQNYSYAKNHPVLRFLSLTDEQVQKINALHKEHMQAQSGMWKDRPQDKDAMKEYYTKMRERQRAANEQMTAKISDVLTDEQRAKFKAAEEAREACQKSVREAQIKATQEREDKLLKILGDGYKEEAEKNKRSAESGAGGAPFSVSPR
jgi:Spy/CpxP family protein refolding chaperone